MADLQRKMYNGWILENINGKIVRQNINGATMEQIGTFENGIAEAFRHEGMTSAYYIVTDHGDILANIPKEKFSAAHRIAREPAQFLEMPTRYFEDKALVDDLLFVAKNSLRGDVEKADSVSVEYLEYVRDLSKEFKEKIERENENLRTLGKEEVANKNEVLDLIDGLGREL
ncbi:MAG: hypothetical protein J6K39_04295 [Clostridia bacterium]|nr:hypothetical protein [Clostridia bacterium]